MKVLTIRKRYYNNKNLIALEFCDEKGIDTGIIIPAYDSVYYFNNIIYHLIINYPQVLKTKLSEYKVKTKIHDWNDEFDEYNIETITHKLKDEKIEVIFGDCDNKLVDVKDFILALNKIANKNGYLIR